MVGKPVSQQSQYNRTNNGQVIEGQKKRQWGVTKQAKWGPDLRYTDTHSNRDNQRHQNLKDPGLWQSPRRHVADWGRHMSHNQTRGNKSHLIGLSEAWMRTHLQRLSTQTDQNPAAAPGWNVKQMEAEPQMHTVNTQTRSFLVLLILPAGEEEPTVLKLKQEGFVRHVFIQQRRETDMSSQYRTVTNMQLRHSETHFWRSPTFPDNSGMNGGWNPMMVDKISHIN